MSRAWIALGSNLGDRANLLARAVNRLSDAGAIPLAVSHLYETIPEGGRDEPLYLNAVLLAETEHTAFELWELLLETERSLGRPARGRSGPRTCDLDLLAFDESVMESPALTLPHPRMHERPFVLVPVCELDPTWRHPRFGQSAADLLAGLAVVPGAIRLHGPLVLAEPVGNAYPWRHRTGAAPLDEGKPIESGSQP